MHIEASFAPIANVWKFEAGPVGTIPCHAFPGTWRERLRWAEMNETLQGYGTNRHMQEKSLLYFVLISVLFVFNALIFLFHCFFDVFICHSFPCLLLLQIETMSLTFIGSSCTLQQPFYLLPHNTCNACNGHFS